MASGMDQPWHSSAELQRALLDFHESYASYPKLDIAAAKQHHEKTMLTIRNDFQKEKLAIQFEFTGSTYEGIKVPSTDVEFDIMVVLAGGKDIKMNKTRPLYAQLTTDATYEPLSKIAQSSVLMPENAAHYFQSKLQRTLNRNPELNRVIKLRRHGPAIQMDVYKDEYMNRLFYSVDMVPSFYIPEGWLTEGGYYVAKAFKEGDDEQGVRCTWRKSFSLEEKAKIQTIDRGNQCRKQCMRMLKVLRDREPGLHHINSYIIKTAVMSLDNQYHLDWNQKNLGKRFIDVLKFLSKALEESNLPHFYVPEFNLFEVLTWIHRENMMYRLKELIRSEVQFYAALKPKRTFYGEGLQFLPKSPQFLNYDDDDDDDEVGQQVQSSGGAQYSREKEETGSSLLGSLLLGGAALAGALWLGATLSEKKDEKEKK